MPIPPSVLPWLQRLLIAWAASTVASGAVLATAENRRRPKKATKKKRRRKIDGEARPPRPRPPVLLGSVAKADAAAPVESSMTWPVWREAVAARGRSVWRFVSGQPKEGAVDDNGARIPDEVVGKDGTKVRLKRKGTKTGARRRRRGEKRKEATLFDSAKESLRQVMKEEAQKAVDEKVEQAGLKKAADVLKDASDKVSETAKDVGARAVDVAQKVKESIPEDANEKIQQAGRTVFAGAKSAFSKLAATIQTEVRALEGERVDDNSEHRGDIIDVAPAIADTARVRPAESNVNVPTPDAPPPPSPPSDALAVTQRPSASEGTSARPDETRRADVTPASPDAPGKNLADAVGEGAKVVGDGVQRLGSFLSGPGNPGYQRGSGRRVATGDVVEAKDAPPREP